MKLVVDIGNTNSKAAIFDNDLLVHVYTQEKPGTDFLQSIFIKTPWQSSILSSVTSHSRAIDEFLIQKGFFLKLDHTTPVPIKNCYKSPETLGKDRLAAAVAGNHLFPGCDVLVIDAGSCVKYDFINSAGEYIGGAISPGIQMRFKALHTFTGKLPLVNVSDCDEIIGTDTKSSILSGVINGLIQEIDGIVKDYNLKFPGIKVVLSGGDFHFLADKLKSKIFAVPNIVINGLKLILDYNEKHKP